MDVFFQIKELISEQFGIDKEKIVASSHLREDLNADPLMIADFITALENKFNIKIPQEEVVKFNSVSDIVEYIEDQNVES